MVARPVLCRLVLPSQVAPREVSALFRADYSGQFSSEQGGEGVTDQGRMLAGCWATTAL